MAKLSLGGAHVWLLLLSIHNNGAFQIGGRDHALSINRPDLVILGEEVSFSCVLASPIPANENCSVTTPGGVEWNVGVTDGAVTEAEGGAVVAGVNGIVDEERRTCGVVIEAVDGGNIGEWSCMINSSPFHRGIFNILTSDEGYVKEGIRLPRHLLPSVYEVKLLPILENENYTTLGRISVKMDLQEDTEDEGNWERITFHAKQIVIHEDTVEVKDTMGSILPIAGHEYDLERDFYAVILQSPLTFDLFLKHFTISMDFTSQLVSGLNGFYTSSYEDFETGETKVMATTQFEKPYARLAFPCLDEPDFKSMFVITLGRHESMHSVSNMPLNESTPITEEDNLPGFQGSDYFWDKFQATKVMSTYLLAFLVSELASSKVEIEEGSEPWTINIHHIPGKENQTAVAATFTPQILSYYEDYFGIDYPVPKCDIGAIPDFRAGAMENWGLILYREVNILYLEGVSGEKDRNRILNVIAHELSHQWFGNLVTMHWWTDLWLNEGFARYMDKIGSDSVEDGVSQSRDRLIVDERQVVFENDALKTTSAISMEINNPYFEAVDTSIAYAKGACVIWMTEHFLGKDTFNKGLHNYLVENAYQNAERSDLWEALDKVGREDGTFDETFSITDVMEGWSTQPGYPVVTVTGQTADMGILYDQKQFFFDSELSSDSRWYIPITVRYPKRGPGGGGALSSPIWTYPDDPNPVITIIEKPYIFNVDQSGYYRVNYREENWVALTELLQENDDNDKYFTRLTRAQLLDDSFNLARSGQLNYAIPLNMSTYIMEKTEDYIPLKSFLNANSYLEKRLRHEAEDLAALNQFVTTLLATNYGEESFTIDDEDDLLDILKKRELITVMGSYEYADCVMTAQVQFSAWMEMGDPDKDNPINPDLRQAIYEIAVREGGNTEFEFLKARLENGPKEQETLRTIYGLSASTSLDNIEWLLNQTISENSSVKSQDIKYVYGGIGDTNFGRRLGFDWLNLYYDNILSYFGELFPNQVGEILSGILDDVNNQDEVTELQRFLDDHVTTLGSAAQDIEDGIDNADVTLRWDTAHKEDVVSWIKQFNADLPTTTTTGSEASSSASYGSEASTMDSNGSVTATTLTVTHLCLLIFTAVSANALF